MRHVPRWLPAAVLALGVWLLEINVLFAGTVSFTRISNNGSNVSGSQFTATYEAFGTNQVKITINNAGPDGEVHEVYIDDDTLYIAPPIAGLQDKDQSIGGLFGLDGVDFTQDGLGSATTNPSELPENDKASPTFTTTAHLSADQDSGGKGIGAGEYLGILLELKSGKTFAQVDAGFKNGTFRIGLHVGDLGAGGRQSEAFVNTPPPSDPPPGTETMPEPSSIALVVVGALGFGASRLRRKRAPKV